MGDLVAILKELGPSAGVVVVVLLFLRHLQHQSATADIASKERYNAIRDLANNCHEHHTQNTSAMTAAIGRCTKSHEDNTVMLARIRDTLEKFDNHNQKAT